MVDLYLQAMMHRELPSQQPKSNSSNSVKDKFDLAAEKYIKEYLNSLNLEIEYGQNQFVTPAMKRAQIRQEMLAKMKASEEDGYLSEAFNFINSNGEQYLGQEFYPEVVSELERIDDLIEKMDPGQEFPEKMQSFYNFNEHIAEEISKLAILKFHEEEYKTSLSLLVLLATLFPENNDYWYKLGIAAQKCEQYDLALRAYGEALQLKPDHIGVKLFSVECYLEKDLVEEAKSQLREAKKLAEKLEGEGEVDEMWISFMKELEIITGWQV